MDVLKEGIAAAKTSDKVKARHLLDQALRLDPRSEVALLWLAGLAESPLEAVGHLERVLVLHPGHEKALAALRIARLQAGIAAAKAQDRSQARLLLHKSVEQDPGSEVAWMWLASLADRPEDAVSYLEKVLALNPGNERARIGLERYRTQLAPALPPPLSPPREEPLPVQPTARRPQPSDKVTPRPAVEVPARNRTGSCTRREQPRPPVQERRKTILVVDDSPTIRKLVSMIVERQGYQARTAADGYQAIDALRVWGIPDLILLDIAMPGMDGYQLCKLMRQNADTSRIPIVMLSGKDGFFNKVRGRIAGSTEYITKPFENESLVRVLDKYCPLAVPAAVAGDG